MYRHTYININIIQSIKSHGRSNKIPGKFKVSFLIGKEKPVVYHINEQSDTEINPQNSKCIAASGSYEIDRRQGHEESCVQMASKKHEPKLEP